METHALFQAALGLSAPWRVSSIDFDAAGSEGRGQLDIHLDFERGARFTCPECSAEGHVHDTAERRWRHLDFFQHVAYLHARVPRVRCPSHGVRTVDVPWARPESGFTLLFEAYVMVMAREMPLKALSRQVGEWDTRLRRIVIHHVKDARERVDMREVRELAVDETSQAKRHRYVTLFAEPGGEDRPPRVLFVASGRGRSTFHDFVKDLRQHGGWPGQVRDLCMDMSKAFQQGAAETLPFAEITFDRFHVMQVVSRALDDARRRERKERPELKSTRYDWLKNPRKLKRKSRERLERLSQLNLKTAKAYQMRLNLQDLWEKDSEKRARRHLCAWCSWVEQETQRPKEEGRPWVLEKMHGVAKSLRANADKILNYYRRRRTTGLLEGINSLVQAARARARGYRNVETFKAMIYLIAGKLRFALPTITHTR